MANTLPSLNRLKLRHVRLLLAVHEGGTLRQAATQLGVTQPAATKMLHELEDALGLKLFERAGRGLRWTAAGHRVLEHFSGLQGGLAALARELAQMAPEGVQLLQVGAIMAASTDVLAPALLALRQQYPQLGVGAAFDYEAGNIRRAPAWMQRCNLEWLYRLMQDPKRLFKRYFVTNTKFLWWSWRH